MSDVPNYKINCYPACPKNPDIITNMLKLTPCIDITKFNTSTLFKDFESTDKATKRLSELANLLNKASEERGGDKISPVETDNEGKPTNTYSDDLGWFADGIKENNTSATAFSSYYGFFSMLSTKVDSEAKNIPIASSPQIGIDNGAGWAPIQSLFQFLKSVTEGGLIGQLTQALGVKGLVSGTINSVEFISGLFGLSPQITPYFSFKNDPFQNKPSITVTLNLINDTKVSTELNALFLNCMVRDSLIGSQKAAEGKGKENNGIWHQWVPPKLFNVGLKWGCSDTEGPYVKKFHLCSLNATVEPKGIMRHGIPDAYSVSMSFKSILPDTIDLWMDGGFPLAPNPPSLEPKQL